MSQFISQSGSTTGLLRACASGVAGGDVLYSVTAILAVVTLLFPALVQIERVRLFTPGTRGGRPLSLSVVPDLQQIPDHERDRMVQYAANALAAMMNYGTGAADSACRPILTQAIAVLARRNRPCGLTEPLELLERMLQDGGAVDLGRTPSLLRTEQIPEQELIELAASARPRT